MNFNNSNRRAGALLWSMCLCRGLGPNRLGSGGSCICPQCGKEVEHTTGQPCNQMDDLTKRLAELLWDYEMDEPHTESPNFINPPEKQYYADIKWDEIVEWSKMEHHGDCVKQPCSCMKCEADYLIHKAKWIRERLD